uniref:Uncharacterized protein n=1 Tax=Arundo donax TaxID=35708 RepID=A0A0A9A812_ARUDO
MIREHNVTQVRILATQRSVSQPRVLAEISSD